MNNTAWAALLLGAAVLAVPRRRRLRRADVGRRSAPGRRTLLALAGSAAVAVVATTGVAVALSAVLVAATLLARRTRRVRRGTLRCEGRDLAAALEVLVGELRIGSHPVRGFLIAGSEAGGPVGEAFAAVAARARLGSDVAAGLRATARTSPAPRYWSRVALYWQLGSDQGLPMAALMRAAHRDVEARHRFADRVQASLAGARATAGVLAGLPVLGVLLGQLVGARPVEFLLSGGGWVLVLGIALLCVGVAWSDHIIDRVAS